MHRAHEALRAAGASARRIKTTGPTVLVVGGGGALGSAVLEQLLGQGRFAHVRVLVTQTFKGTVRGLEPVLCTSLDDGDAPQAAPDGAPAPPPSAAPSTSDTLATLAVVVFDRERRANGREEALLRADPNALPALSRWLWRRGVRDVVIVMPHAPAVMPEALKLGLASLGEQAVASQGFNHVVFVRTAQESAAARGRPWPQRVADGLLKQLLMMIPASHKPVRVGKVSRFIAEIAARLASASPGARVVPPELVWRAAQVDDIGALAAAWLAGNELPQVNAPRMRL